MRRATLGFVPMSIGWRLVGGAAFGIAWTICAAFPVVRALESDVPDTMMLGLMCLVAITPALLAARREALAATLVWDDHAITHLLGGRVKTAIAWKDATVRTGEGGLLPRVLQIVDVDGRCISLVEGHGLVPPWLDGRRFLAKNEADELLALAERLGCPREHVVLRRSEGEPPLVRDWLRILPLAAAAACFVWVREQPALVTVQAMLVCWVLLVPPLRRVARALARKSPREWIAFDSDALGVVHARRLDGGRVLVDLTAAHHPDALVASRRGFVGATLRERIERPSSPYRTGERVLDAVDVETQADRVLRFERLRTAFVDVFAYGGLFAMSVAAVLVT